MFYSYIDKISALGNNDFIIFEALPEFCFNVMYVIVADIGFKKDFGPKNHQNLLINK